MSDPTRRFSDRVGDYVKYRPHYPGSILTLLATDCGLTEDWTIADIGSGTGILSRLFLNHGNRVFGVEPNREMRHAGEQALAAYPRFTSVAGSAEATTLCDGNVDMITAGQAFHWFDRARARDEFARILKPRGWVVMVWNERRKTGSEFLMAYESLLQTYGTDYRQVDHSRIGMAAIRAFLRSNAVRLKTFDNRQELDGEGLEGRLRSASYAPNPAHPDHASMLEELAAIFAAHQVEGRVTIEYDTKVYFGRIPGDGSYQT